MKTDIEQLSPTSKKISIEIEPDEVDRKIDQAYKEIQKRAKIKGFRPGRAPIKLLERYYGKQVIEDVTKELINESFPKALQDSELFPLNFPILEKGTLEKGKSFRYSAVMEVRPEIELGEYRGIEVKKEKVHITEEDVDKRLEEIRKAHGRLTSVESDRPVKEDDYVILEYAAFSGGQPLEDIKASNFMVRVGSGDFHPEFEKALIGAKKGEEKAIHVDFEQEYYHSQLAGKSIDFQVKISDIKEMELPEVNDDFARRLDAEFDSFEALRARVKEMMIQQETQRVEREAKSRLIEKIAEGIELPLPSSLVESEILSGIESVRQDLMRSGSSLEKAGLSEEKLREEFRPSAEKKVKQSLILTEIAKKENITVTEEDLEEAFQDLAKTTGQEVEPLRRYYEARGLIDSMRQRLLEQKTLNYLMEHANIIEDETSATEQGANSKQEETA